MLGFRHPRPFDRKELAVLVKRATARTTIEAAPVLYADPETTPSPGDGVQGRPALTFVVRYRLREYLSIVADHVGELSQAPDRPGTSPLKKAAIRAWVALIGTPLFFLKRRAMPSMTFNFSPSGIERVSKAGARHYPWQRIRSVKRYAQGYLFILADQCMLVPYRCLHPAQESAMQALLTLNDLGGCE
jgi:hypothetical protein